MNSMTDLFLNPFSHIYVEKDVCDEPATKNILGRLKDREVVVINDYKDLFNRPQQDASLQAMSKKLILARKKGEFVYPGSRMCNDFKINSFYYVSQAMNCPFQCEYCFLQGMYKTANMVIFVNEGDFFEALDRLPRVETFVAISYDTDLLAIDPLSGFLSGWMAFARTRPHFTFELRTKAVNISPLMLDDVPQNLIISYTLSPQEIIERYERLTPDLHSRMAAVNRLLDRGYRVRLAFEPLLPVDDFEHLYEAFLRDVSKNIDLKRIYDVSLSPFHINRRHLQYLRGFYPHSPVLNYPYDDLDDTSVVRKGDSDRMLKTVIGLLEKEMDEKKIFVWEPGKNKQKSLQPGL